VAGAWTIRIRAGHAGRAQWSLATQAVRPGDGSSHSAGAFRIRSVRISALFALSPARTCRRLWL